MNSAWGPSCSIDFIHQRAQILQQIRRFFAERNIVEVDTPILNPYCSAELHIEPFEISGQFLQTSPEWAMKRLLAAMGTPLYQICKVFRRGERGRLHNPEFTLIEWYHEDMSYRELMQEVEAFFIQLLRVESCDFITYGELFKKELGLDPFTANLDTLKKSLAHLNIQLEGALNSLSEGLDLLFAHIQPTLASEKPLFVYDFPLCQASYAKIRGEVSERFEVLYRGIELANGYSELEQVQDLVERHRQFNQNRNRSIPLDPLSIEALKVKKCHSAGVAVGLERLLMTKFQLETIDFVMTFPQ